MTERRLELEWAGLERVRLAGVVSGAAGGGWNDGESCVCFRSYFGDSLAEQLGC